MIFLRPHNLDVIVRVAVLVESVVYMYIAMAKMYMYLIY